MNCPICQQDCRTLFNLMLHKKVKHGTAWNAEEEKLRDEIRAKMDTEPAPEPALFEDRTKRRSRNRGPDDL